MGLVGWVYGLEKGLWQVGDCGLWLQVGFRAVVDLLVLVGLWALECVCAWSCKMGRYVIVDGPHMLSCMVIGPSLRLYMRSLLVCLQVL